MPSVSVKAKLKIHHVSHTPCSLSNHFILVKLYALSRVSN